MTVEDVNTGSDRPISRSVTLADIARAAGTSSSTASRALSGRGYVSSATRRRLVAAAERLGYVPDASAQTLKQRLSRVVGVVVSNLNDPFYAKVAAGVEQTLRAADYQVVLVTDNSDPGQELAAARTFLALRTPGVILTPVGTEAAALLIRQGAAVVEVDRQLNRGTCDAALLDNVQAAHDAMSHLLGLGHRRVALLTVATPWTSDTGRRRGYQAALEDAGVAFDPDLLLAVPPRESPVETGRLIAGFLRRQRPTAVLAANNTLTVRAWYALRAAGLRLPDDVSLVGFDDEPWMEMVTPGITAVAQPATDIGRRAAHLLLRRMEVGTSQPAIEELHATLVVRGSTGPP